MEKFIIGFALGLAVGAAAVILLAPPETDSRARWRVRTDQFASGEETPVGAARVFAETRRNRLEEAIDAGRRASAEKQRELWAELKLDPPPPDASATA